jgi:hypothetical protein
MFGEAEMLMTNMMKAGADVGDHGLSRFGDHGLSR